MNEHFIPGDKDKQFRTATVQEHRELMICIMQNRMSWLRLMKQFKGVK